MVDPTLGRPVLGADPLMLYPNGRWNIIIDRKHGISCPMTAWSSTFRVVISLIVGGLDKCAFEGQRQVKLSAKFACFKRP